MKFQGLLSLVASTGLFLNLANALPQVPQPVSNTVALQPQTQASLEITQSFDASFSLVSNYANTIESDCEKGSVGSVTQTLESIQSSVVQLSQQFQTGLVLPRPSADGFAQRYIKLLLKFQILIKTIYRFPAIVIRCRPLLIKYTLHFLKIHKFFRTCGINISQSLQQNGGFDFELWGHLGFGSESGGLTRQ